jgi:hypothetical protein
MFFIIKAITVALSSESCLFSKLEVVFSVIIENNFVNERIPVCRGQAARYLFLDITGQKVR